MTGAPVLVGVDGSAVSLAIVDLAIREATLRGRALRVVYGDPWANHPAWWTFHPAARQTRWPNPTRPSGTPPNESAPPMWR